MAGKTEYPLSIILRAVDKATAVFRKVARQAESAGKKMESIGQTLSTGLSAPIAAVGAASVHAFGQFEKGMSSVSTLIDSSKENLDAMGATVLAIGRRTPVAIADLTGALYDVRSAGVAATDQFTVLEQSARLGVAGLGTTKESVDLVTSSMNAFKLQGEDAQQVYDQIFKTVKFGKTTIAGLSQGFGSVAGQVAATGTKLDEYLASVAALTTTGLPASEAHTQLRAVMAGLTRDTKDTRKVFRALGAKDFKELIAESGGLVPALQRISGELGGNTSKILTLTGSTEALNAILGLTGAQAATYTAALKDMREGVNAVDVAFQKQNATITASTQRTKNALTSMGVSIGRILSPALESVASMLQSVADAWATLDETTQKWIVSIGLVVAAIGPAILIVGKMIAVMVALKKVFVVVQTLIIGLKALSTTLFATPFGWVVLGIAALVTAGYFLIKHWDKVKLFLESMWEVVQEAFAVFLDWVKFAFFNFTPLGLIIKHWEPIKGWFAELWDGVVSVFEGAWQTIKGIVDELAGVVGTVTGAVDSVVGAVGSVGGSIGSFFSGDDDSGAPVAGGMAMGPPLLGGAVDRVAGGGSASTSAAVRVEFANAPRGTRVVSERGNTADVDLSVGYQMGLL